MEVDAGAVPAKAPGEAAERPLLSVVLVSFNSARVLPRTLSEVRRLLPDAEVIVVDNGSTDDTVSMIRRDRPEAILLADVENAGFGAAANRGATAASGELLLLLNPDALPVAATPDELDRLAREEAVGLRACRVRARGGEYFPCYPPWGWCREILWSLSQAFLTPRRAARPRPLARDPASIDWVPAAGVVVRRAEFLEAGGFDPRYFMYCEDRDLSRRYRGVGWPLGVTTAVTVTHEGGGSSPVHSTRRHLWSLLGLLEYVSRWDSPRAAERAARYLLAGLEAIALAGRPLAWAPVLGPRVGRKAREAREVREAMLDFCAGDDPAEPEHYPAAFRALRAAPAARGRLGGGGRAGRPRQPVANP